MTASDLRERAKALITKLQNGEPCDPNDDDIEPIAAEFAAIRAAAKAEGWDDAARALRDCGLINVADWLDVNRPE